jgi:hypothetical protein
VPRWAAQQPQESQRLHKSWGCFAAHRGTSPLLHGGAQRPSGKLVVLLISDSATIEFTS